ncbi:Mariner Mos1 transposase [Anthophora quadrimaculata]
MKSGLFMITPSVGNRGLTLVNLRHGYQSLISTRKKFCSAFGGIVKAYCIMSCYSRVKQSKADRYKQQLTNLSDVLEEKRPFTGQGSRKVLLLRDNARSHVAKATQNHIFSLGWELIPHAACSPDMAPSDYHLFRSLQHHLADRHFERLEEIRQCIDDFNASKPVSFYREGIRQLPKRWQKAIDANGDYYDD